MARPIDELTSYLATVYDLDRVAAVLTWDQRTYMPSGGSNSRAQQLTTLAKLGHQYKTAPELGQLLDASEASSGDLDEVERALVRVARRDFEQERKLPSELVTELTHVTSVANEAWQAARATADWALFAPHLEAIVRLYRQVAEHLGYREHPYDALLDQYEPGMTTAHVRSLFNELQAGIVPLVQAIAQQHATEDDKPLYGHFEPAAQLAFAWRIGGEWGFDQQRGRMDPTTHPFCTSFGRDDVRITTRTFADYLAPALFGTFHETGHGLYEQGIDTRLGRGPLGRAASLGLHESQSRMWENLVGRSLPFWKRHYGELQAAFPRLNDTSLQQFYKAINAVQPSMIRVEADELTYNLHILLRFEIELQLLEDTVAVQDLPQLWRDQMEQLLGIVPRNDAEGVLQDVHWSHGGIGYFPTYTLGNVLSVQLLRAAEQERP
ncbi:MAG: carboxypeptidase M32 [Herpetosiphon sp.]